MQLDPMVSLAHAIHSRPRRYALLLGSGVSRSAGIATGWEILGQLIGRIRSLEGADGADDNARWFEQRFSERPDYSRVVERLGRTECERQELLRGFFEPGVSESGTADKRPTAAHRAIARLVKGDFVQVIVTTNFDRLVETALADEGVHPTVISSDHQVAGMVPLVHQQAVVFKLNGDYRDPSIRNTAGELREYGPATTGLLSQICESYGLVVCGWSGEWDLALRSALEAANARRFSMYWASRGEPTEAAQSLIRAREAEVVKGVDADNFFHDLASKVLSLRDATTAHPQSLQLLAAESRRLVRVADDVPYLQRAIQAVVERARAAIVRDAEVVAPGSLPTPEKWITSCHGHLAEVYAACIPAARWAAGRQVNILQDVVQRLHELPRITSHPYMSDELHRLVPSFLMFHIIGAAMAAGRNWPALLAFVAGTRWRDESQSLPYVIGVHWPMPQTAISEAFYSERSVLAASRWLLARWNDVGAVEVPSSLDRTEAFLRLELAVALAYSTLKVGSLDRASDDISDLSLPLGLYAHLASRWGGNRDFVKELLDDTAFTKSLSALAGSQPRPIAVSDLYQHLGTRLAACEDRRSY